MFDLQANLNGLRPSFDVRPLDQTPEDRRAEIDLRLAKLKASFNRAFETLGAYEPFYQSEVHNDFEEALKAARTR